MQDFGGISFVCTLAVLARRYLLPDRRSRLSDEAYMRARRAIRYAGLIPA